jgi:hypothetical protein
MVDIELLQNSKVRETIGKVKSDSHRFNWAIPDTLDSSKMYAIRIGNSTCKWSKKVFKKKVLLLRKIN